MKSLFLLLAFVAASAHAFICSNPSNASVATAHFAVNTGKRCSIVFNNDEKVTYKVGPPDVAALCKVIGEKDVRVCAVTQKKLAFYADDQGIPEPFNLNQLTLDRTTVDRTGPAKEEDFDHHCFPCAA